MPLTYRSATGAEVFEQGPLIRNRVVTALTRTTVLPDDDDAGLVPR